MISLNDFEKIDLRVGTILRAAPFPEAKKPAFKLWVDLGELGTKQSSAQITGCYEPGELVGKQVICVVNFPPRQIATFMSEVLVTGVNNQENQVVLCTVDKPVSNGSKVY